MSLINRDKLYRMVFCKTCEIVTISNEPNPLCKQCGGPLTIIVWSALTGKPLKTGEK